MKKLLVVLLALSMVFAFAACGEKTEQATDEAQPASSIDLGGGLGEYSLEGTACGQYEVIDTPEEWLSEGCEVTTYADLDCDVPYITVYRWNKEGKTLDEEAQAYADKYGNGYYQDMTDPVLNIDSKYCCGDFEFEGDFYYCDAYLLEDGDDIVEIDFCSKTTEVAIGDTGVYAWVPVGYTDSIDQEAIDHGTVFEASYSKEYYLPYIWIGLMPEDNLYEYDSWYWSYDYPDGIPVTEEEYYKNDSKEWNIDTCKEYYKLFGVDVDYASIEDDSELPYNGEIYLLTKDGKNYATEIGFTIDGKDYGVWLGFELDPVPAIAHSFLNSLHTK